MSVTGSWFEKRKGAVLNGRYTRRKQQLSKECRMLLAEQIGYFIVVHHAPVGSDEGVDQLRIVFNMNNITRKRLMLKCRRQEQMGANNK
jgi:hypothetical protein